MACMICDKNAGFSSIKLKYGRVCRQCAKKLPSLIVECDPYIKEYSLKHAVEYAQENMNKFYATASFGKLHIDQVHSLFCIADKLDKNGKPKKGNNVFSAYDLTEVGLYCTSPRAAHNNVLVNAEFSFQMESPMIKHKLIVKRSMRCQTKRVDSQHVEWKEPGEIEIFRTLFNQILSGAFENVQSILCGKTVHEFEIEKARAIFMLTEDYTSEDLKKARRLMMKVYHPDVAKEDVSRESQIINNAYNLLKENIENQD